MNLTKTEKYKYPIRHSHTDKDGEILYWTDDNKKGHFGVPKVILIKGTYIYPLNDFEGKYGMSNYSFGIPITSKKEGDDIVKALNTDKFIEIIKATKWQSGFTDHNMFKYFKPEFYKQFLSGKKYTPEPIDEASDEPEVENIPDEPSHEKGNKPKLTKKKSKLSNLNELKGS